MRRVITAPMPAGAGTGSAIPEPVDIHHLAARGPFLAAPAGYGTMPDIITTPYPVAVETLFDALSRVGAARPNTRLVAAYPTRLQAHYVIRGGWVPLLLVVEAVGVIGGAAPLLHARSLNGLPGFGAPRRHVKEWLAALDAVLKE